MADNDSVFAGNAGAQILVATDDIGGVKYQRVKLNVGGDGLATDVVNAADKDAVANGFGILPSGLLGIDNSGFYRLLRTSGADGATPIDKLGVVPGFFNETTVDRQRGNTEGVVFPSAARTAITNSANLTNYNARGVLLVAQVTVAGTGNLDLRVMGKVDGKDVYLHGAASTLITTTGQWGIMFYPGASAAGLGANGVNGFFPGALPRTWWVQVIPSGSSSWTYAVSYALIV